MMEMLWMLEKPEIVEIIEEENMVATQMNLEDEKRGVDFLCLKSSFVV